MVIVSYFLASAALLTTVQQDSLAPKRIFEMALGANPQYEAAKQKVREAQAKLEENVHQFAPSLALTGSASLSRGNLPQPAQTNSFYGYQGQLVLNLPNRPRVSAFVRAAQSQLMVAQLELRKTILDLGYRSLEASYGLLRAQEALNVAQENLAQADRQVQDTQERINAGDLPRADVLKTQIPELQAKAAVLKAQSALTLANQTLNSLIGRTLDQPVDLSETPSDPRYSIAESDAISEVLRNSPDVLEAQQNVENARANLSVARRANDPQFSLQATQTHTSDPTTYTNLGSLGATVTIPIFDNGVFRQQVLESRLEVSQAESALKTAQQQATLSVESALANLASANADYSTAQQVFAIASESSQKAQQAYQAGLTTTREVLDAQVALAQARVDLNSAKYALSLSVAKLKQLLGEDPL